MTPSQLGQPKDKSELKFTVSRVQRPKALASKSDIESINLEHADDIKSIKLQDDGFNTKDTKDQNTYDSSSNKDSDDLSQTCSQHSKKVNIARLKDNFKKRS